MAWTTQCNNGLCFVITVGQPGAMACMFSHSCWLCNGLCFSYHTRCLRYSSNSVLHVSLLIYLVKILANFNYVSGLHKKNICVLGKMLNCLSWVSPSASVKLWADSPQSTTCKLSARDLQSTTFTRSGD